MAARLRQVPGSPCALALGYSGLVASEVAAPGLLTADTVAIMDVREVKQDLPMTTVTTRAFVSEAEAMTWLMTEDKPGDRSDRVR
jgi:hypothetical protein